MNNNEMAENATVPWVILHVPHASLLLPADVRDRLLLSDQELDLELNRLTDHFTDELFRVSHPAVVTVQFPISRFVVDPERFHSDEQEPMAERGQGVIYTQTTDGTPLRHPPDQAERAALLDKWYWPHHRELEKRTLDALAAHGRALVIDCHSFPRLPLPVDLDQTPNRPHFCIGTDPFHTPGELAEAFKSQLQRDDYTVALDRPYAGTLVPSFAWRKDPRVISIMVEVNRRLYLKDEPRDVSCGKDFERIRRVVRGLVLSATQSATSLVVV